MYQTLRKRLSGKEDGGFTLIELLIVIAILGILATIVVFAVGTATSDSKLSACKADKKTLSVALEAYKAKTGTYPAGTMNNTSNGALVDDYMKTWPHSTDTNFSVTGGVITVGGTTTC